MGIVQVVIAWLIGLSALYQTAIAVLTVVVVFGGPHGGEPYQQGQAIGRLVGAVLMLFFALWLRRKGIARIKARRLASDANGAQQGAPADVRRQQ